MAGTGPYPKRWLLSPQKLLTDTPWRTQTQYGAALEDSILNDLMQLDSEKSPGILMLGPVGAGKSSFINSCLSVGVGRKKALAQTGWDVGSYTLELANYRGSNWLKNYRFMDCMGIEGTYGHGFNPQDIMFLLQGHVKKNYEFNQEPLTKKSKYYEPNPKPENKTHCVVFVIDARTIYDGIPHAYVDKIKWLQKEVDKAAIPRVLILTKCDLICSKVQEDANTIFRSVKVERAVENASKVFAIDISSIHPVVNYEVDIELSTAKNIPILLALRQILPFACDCIKKESELASFSPMMLTRTPWMTLEESEATRNDNQMKKLEEENATLTKQVDKLTENLNQLLIKTKTKNSLREKIKKRIPFLVKSKKRVQIVDSVQTISSTSFARTLMYTLNDFDCLMKNTANIEYEIPLIVVCMKSTRLKPDIELALENVSYPAQCVVVIVHTGAETNLPAIPSSAQLSGYRGNIEFIDIVFDFVYKVIYRCQQNNTALGYLREYINRFG